MLTDPEVLELNELCGATVDGTLTDVQRRRLARWLVESEAARRFYVRALGQSASLHGYAAELMTEAPEERVRRPGSNRRWRHWAAGLVAAAALAIMGFVLRRERGEESTPAARPSDFVGRVSGARAAAWRSAPLAPGAHLRKGQRLELAAGVVEVTFDSGARVVLEGAAALEINSAWEATLRRGTLKTSVPREAIGFRISHPAVAVVDLGTEFLMVADAAGADVFVLKGEVEAVPRAPVESEAILLRENESRRFAATGVMPVADGARKFAQWAEPPALERLAPPTRLVHWSFDEVSGGVFLAQSSGPLAEEFAVKVLTPTDGEWARAHSEGQRNGALVLAGGIYASASLPGISDNTPHTVAFWARVPPDAPLSEAYSMVTWATRNKKLRNRHVGINWNTDHADGPIGALRTDFGGGQAVGMTSLRDGRWHHIAVCFSPGDEDPTVPVQVKQYVDGRLESSTIIPGKKRGPAVADNSAFADIVWLGCHLGVTGPRAKRFRGEIDELFIADRGLEPFEIVALMKDNRLPGAMLAAHP